MQNVVDDTVAEHLFAVAQTPFDYVTAELLVAQSIQEIAEYNNVFKDP